MCQPGRPGPIVGLPRRLARLGRLPEREIADVVLAVLVGLHPLPDPETLGIEAGQAPVRRPRRDPEEDRAVVGPVRVPSLEEQRDQRDDLVDVACRPRQDVRRRHPQRVGIGQERGQVALGERLDRLAGRGRAADDLVVDVGDVHDPASPARHASGGSARAGRRTGTSGSCRCGPAHRRSGRTSRCRSGPSRSGTSGRVSPDSVSCRRTVTTPPPASRRRAPRSRGRRPRRRRGCRSTP